MERGEFSLEHSFSGLEPLQKAHTVRYGCRYSGSLCEMTAQEGARFERCVVPICGRKAELLVHFLCENAVAMENWQDVVMDAVPLLQMAGEEKREDAVPG